MAGRPRAEWRQQRPPRERVQITVRIPRELQDWAEREALRRASVPPFRQVTLSEVVRLGLEELRRSAPPEPEISERAPCMVVRNDAARISRCLACGRQAVTAEEVDCGWKD